MFHAIHPGGAGPHSGPHSHGNPRHRALTISAARVCGPAAGAKRVCKKPPLAASQVIDSIQHFTSCGRQTNSARTAPNHPSNPGPTPFVPRSNALRSPLQPPAQCNFFIRPEMPLLYSHPTETQSLTAHPALLERTWNQLPPPPAPSPAAAAADCRHPAPASRIKKGTSAGSP